VVGQEDQRLSDRKTIIGQMKINISERERKRGCSK
jgi:hypothetical protein